MAATKGNVMTLKKLRARRALIRARRALVRAELDRAEAERRANLARARAQQTPWRTRNLSFPVWAPYTGEALDG